MATSKVLGTVTSVVGEVKATASDGTTRILQVGDKVFSDEVITTSASGDVKIALEGAGGRSLECGNDTTLALNEGMLGIGTAIAGPDGSSPVVAPSVAAQQETASPTGKPPAGPTDVAALQAAIAAGADPSQVAEATAAGGAPGAGGGDSGGGHQPVILEQGNNTTPVTSGFVTQGGSIQFPTPELNELPPVEGTPVVSVSVQVEVEVEEPGSPGEPGGGVVVSGNAASLIEGTNGEGGGKLVNFIISLDQAFDTEVQVTYTIVPGTADTPSDFFDGPLTQTVTIPAGETQIIVPVIIVEDHFVEGNETFSIVLTDAVNATINPAADTAVVTIVDDDALPVANPDTNWTQEDAFVGESEAPTASGNVLQNQSHPGDPSAVLSFADAADTDFEPLTVTTTGTFNGSFGTLVLNSDGSYTYTLNNGSAAVQGLDSGETLTDSFNYSITDGFNAPDSSTLTVTIFGSNDTPEITVKTSGEIFAEGAEGTVTEAALATGSNAASNGEFITGSFKVTDTDGVDDIDNVTINGDTVAIGSLIGATFDGEAGVLTVTGYAGGIATFTYELTTAVEDGEGLETDVFTLTTSDGTNTSSPATITINIVDDVPTALNDSNSMTEDTVSVSGNVRSNDTQGADRPATVGAGTFEGEFGTLVLNSSGGYTYTLNTGAVQGLDVGESVQEVFPYTLTDFDGDPSPANLTITITGTNDAPVARADTNWVVEDHEVSSVATGNVLEDIAHAGAPQGSFADVADTDVDVEDLTVTAGNFIGDYGTLVLNGDGSYTYTLDGSNEAVQLLGEGQTLTDSFNYTASDGTASVGSTLTITIFGTNDGPSVGRDTARVSEEGLTGGIADGTGNADTTNSNSDSGQIAVSDSDGDPLTVTLNAPSGTLNSGGETIVWSGSGTQTLTGSADGNTIVTVTIDNAGNYTVTLSGPIDHSDTASEDEISFTVGVSATDGESVSNGSLVVTVEDDSPTVSAVAAGNDVLQVDETALAINATEDFSDLFSEAFGADGEGSLGYSLGINEGSTGLVDTASNEAVTLQMSGNVVQGVISGGVVVFTVSVDANGIVTLDQQRAVRHDPNTTADQETSLAGANLITLTATITDNDGDTDAATVNLGHAISFKDDGPNIDVNDAGLPELLVDETDLATNDTASFASMFTNIDHGEDGAGSLTYTLGVNAGSSGLVDTATDQAVTLHLNGSVVEGRVSNGEGGFFVVFTVSVDGSGNVTLDQQRAVKHTPDAGPDQPTSLSEADLVTLTATITDKDGDSDSETIDIGQALTFEDDGPSIDITAGGATVVEGGTISNGAWTSDEGADGGVVKVEFNGTDYDLDEAIDTGKGTLTVNANGTWTFVAANNLDQDVAQSVSFDLKITDADGDFASDSHTISITDGAGPAVSGAEVMLVDEAALADGMNPSSTDEVDTTALTFTSGSDAINSITFGSTAGITVSGLDETQSITWTASNGGRTLTGSVGGVDIIRVDLTGASTVTAGGNTGNVTVTATLLNNFLHQNSPDADSLTISGVQVIGQDPDGDTATHTFTGITVNDDAATVTAPSGIIENDAGESLAGLIDYDMNADGLGTVTLNAPTVTSGGEPLTLTSHGNTIVYQIADNDGDGLQELYAYADIDSNGVDTGDTLVFTLAPATSDAADGSYTLTMQDVVDLPTPTVALDFSNITAGGPTQHKAIFTDATETEAVLLISTTDGTANVNANQGFVGYSNNIMDDPESIKYEFGQVNLADFSVAHEDVNDVQLNIFNTGSGADTFGWTAFKDGVQVGTSSITFSGDGLTSAIHVEGGYDTLVLNVTDGAFKVGGVVFTELGAPQDVNLNVVFGGADADGDAISGSFDVTITSGNGIAESNIVQTLLNNNNETL